MSHRFLELGANVVICGRREDVLEQTAEELTKETGAEIETVRCDVRLPDAVEAMMDRIWQKRPLDILVNNAAGQILAPTHKMSSRAIDAVLGIVLHGSAYCTIAAGRRWIDLGLPGTVLSILTLAALQGGAFTVPSAMAKAGVLAMTRSLAVEWGPKNIRLVAVAPGPFPTPGGVHQSRHSARPLWRAHRACQPLQLSRFRCGRLHHRRMRGDRRWQALPRRNRGRRHAGLDRPAMDGHSRTDEGRHVMNA